MSPFLSFLTLLAIVCALATSGCNVRSGGGPDKPKGQGAPQVENPVAKKPDAAGKSVPGSEPKGKEKAAAPRDPAVIAIEGRQGSVVYDDSQPDRPVIEVNLNFTKTADADLVSLTAFKKLRKLSVPQNPASRASASTPSLPCRNSNTSTPTAPAWAMKV
jgi:hypothetical protein